MSKHFYGAVLMGAILIPVSLQGCSSDNPLCCTEFKAGAQIDANIGGGAESKVAVQAVADISGIASAAIDDLTTACRGMATDLDAPQADRDAAEAKADKTERMKAYCSLAVTAIGTVKASAKATIKVTPPGCSASISAKAQCQGGCSGSAKCDVKLNPPTCEGGKLEVSCKGECKASATAPSIKCEGSCGGTCEGSCTASGGATVKCEGKCEGTCAADAQGGGGGIQADGSCKGTCSGTCTASATAPKVECSGSCNGSCTGSCKATGGSAQVKCDGECTGEFEPLKCSGGELKGGCKVEAKCEANCDASVKAKAECHPGGIDFSFAGDADAAAKLKATLDANFGVISTFSARLDALIKVSASFTANVNGVTDIKAACIPLVIASAVDAVGQVKAAGEATVSVGGAVAN